MLEQLQQFILTPMLQAKCSKEGIILTSARDECDPGVTSDSLAVVQLDEISSPCPITFPERAFPASSYSVGSISSAECQPWMGTKGPLSHSTHLILKGWSKGRKTERCPAAADVAPLKTEEMGGSWPRCSCLQSTRLKLLKHPRR